MANNNTTDTERRGAGALLWHRRTSSRAPLRMGFQRVEEQLLRIETCATRMGITITEQFIGTADYRDEVNDRLNTVTRLLEKHPVQALFITRACLKGIDDDALIAFTVRLMNRGTDLIVCDA
ncbi:hypothetical protein [Arthrobacter woluwensis]|uniref:hypothetical protein n=1 Tax=Arthrobacter woluwensis TaxID=156980 RepID=UPI00119EC944|nr:hypothetical protein [Arthrobacter woluwensis]